jgi:uncharacterized protein (TIGR00730 family)
MTPSRLIKNIAFFGYADFKPKNFWYRDALAIARILAKEGYTIVNGGGGGIMAASTEGAESVGGETIAITFSPQDAPGFEGRYLANRVDKEIKTKNYIERMFKLLEHADSFVIFNGGTGTISEFSTAWVLAKLYYPHHKPFVLYGKFWHKVIDTLKTKMKIRPGADKVCKIVETRAGVLRAIQAFEKEMASCDHSRCQICQDKAFMT